MRKKLMKIKLLDPKAKVPTYAKPGDAGADLYSIEDAYIHGWGQKLIKTGIALEIPNGKVGLVRPRSGLATKAGIGMNSSGVIDAGYRGEIMVNLINFNDESYLIRSGDRIAQILFLDVESFNFEVVDELEESDRGSSGHGSTGGWTV
jgi:dUTP pyrophosphatase